MVAFGRLQRKRGGYPRFCGEGLRQNVQCYGEYSRYISKLQADTGLFVRRKYPLKGLAEAINVLFGNSVVF